MGPLTYVLDSDVIIDFLNGSEAARDFINENFTLCAITPVTRAETLTGQESSLIEETAAWLDSFSLLALDAPACDLAASMRRTNKLKLPDAFQAAAARRHGLSLVTRNTKDFPPRKYDFVMVPYKIN
jgi:predicted nucleic acid-binding protein